MIIPVRCFTCGKVRLSHVSLWLASQGHWLTHRSHTRTCSMCAEDLCRVDMNCCWGGLANLLHPYIHTQPPQMHPCQPSAANWCACARLGWRYTTTRARGTCVTCVTVVNFVPHTQFCCDGKVGSQWQADVLTLRLRAHPSTAAGHW
jgi:hypothetical protein